MKAQEILNPVACKCGSKQFAVSRIRLNSTGPYVDTIVCTNPSCNITYGQVEPDSITTNLSQINEMMRHVASSLGVLDGYLRSQGIRTDSDKEPKSTTPNPVKQTQASQGSTQTTSTPPNPATDPESSDPEADQSPV